jgi:hypothetical protein
MSKVILLVAVCLIGCGNAIVDYADGIIESPKPDFKVSIQDSGFDDSIPIALTFSGVHKNSSYTVGFEGGSVDGKKYTNNGWTNIKLLLEESNMVNNKSSLKLITEKQKLNNFTKFRILYEQTTGCYLQCIGLNGKPVVWSSSAHLRLDEKTECVRTDAPPSFKGKRVGLTGPQFVVENGKMYVYISVEARASYISLPDPRCYVSLKLNLIAPNFKTIDGRYARQDCSSITQEEQHEWSSKGFNLGCYSQKNDNPASYNGMLSQSVSINLFIR